VKWGGERAKRLWSYETEKATGKLKMTITEIE
jgi:hypothetical protein